MNYVYTDNIASWVFSHASDVRFPLLILQGGDDTVVSKEANVRFYKDINIEDKQMYTYPGRRYLMNIYW